MLFNLYFSILSTSGKLEALFTAITSFLNKPNSVLSGAHLVYLNCLTNLDPKTITDYHREWGLAYNHKKPQKHPPLKSNQTTTLRVGYISPDFRSHPIAYFLLSHLKYFNKKRITTYGYHTLPTEDSKTQQFKETFDYWRSTHKTDKNQVIEQIQNDKIDILIDLAGHTAPANTFNTFEIFYERPAQIQVTYLGYPCTTGLTQMDYRIVDNCTDPPGYQEYSTEKLLHLPECFICYSPLGLAPPIVETPLRSPPQIVFGSTNGIHKINLNVISLWAKIYAYYPKVMFLIKSPQFRDPRVVRLYTEYFFSYGVPSEALKFVGFTHNHHDHLDIFNSMDIALDPFPYNGTTTTCEALWMGVPVITLVGNRHSARVSYSILSQLGLDECIAFTEEEYVEKALYLADHPKHLLELRKTLRARMLNSPLCDGRRFARSFEDALFRIRN